MKNVIDIIEFLNEKFREPTSASYDGLVVRSVCNFESPGGKLSDGYPLKVPLEVKEFWTYAKSGDLYKDITYGQWGLHIFSPEDALARSIKEKENRPADIDNNDIVIGSFYGDLDLLIISGNQDSHDFGKVLVAMPLDKRVDWPVVANSFTEFLNLYTQKEGGKFWE